MSEPQFTIKMPTYRTMTLGAFIHELQHMDPSWPITTDTDELISGFSSYRGFYEDIALVPVRQYLDDRPALATVGALLAEARACVGKTFEGYKGGQYVMNRDSDLWFAPEGSASGWRPIGFQVVQDDAALRVRIILCGGL